MHSKINKVGTGLIGGALTATVSIAGLITTPAAAEAAPTKTDVVTTQAKANAIVNLGLTRHEARKLQSTLYDCGYTGKEDGLLGPKSWKALQRCLRGKPGKYSGHIDGIVGPKTVSALQRFLKAHKDYSGHIDGIAGPKTKAGFKKYVNTL